MTARMTVVALLVAGVAGGVVIVTCIGAMAVLAAWTFGLVTP